MFHHCSQTELYSQIALWVSYGRSPSLMTYQCLACTVLWPRARSTVLFPPILSWGGMNSLAMVIARWRYWIGVRQHWKYSRNKVMKSVENLFEITRTPLNQCIPCVLTSHQKIIDKIRENTHEIQCFLPIYDNGQDLLNFSKTTSKIFCHQLYKDKRDKGWYAGIMTCGVCTLVVSSEPEHI